METRANYIAVGFFTLVTLGVVMAVVFWFGRYGDTRDLVPLDVRIEGSVSGLGPGSAVQFNGINVGRVDRLSLDAADPRYVLVHTKISKATPVRSDTKATIGTRGLSGGAFIALQGGSPDASAVMIGQVADGPTPLISGDPAALTELISRVGEIAARTERVMGTLENFVADNEAKASRAIDNVATFSDALAQNSDGVGKFMASAGDVAVSLQNLSSKLDGSLAKVEAILAAVDPKAVENTVRNVDSFTQSLADQRTQISEIVESVNKASVQLNSFTARLGGTLDKVDGVVAAVSPETVRKVVENIDKTTERAERVMAALDGAKIAKAVDDIAATSGNARELVAAIDKETVRSLVAELDTTTKKISTLVAAVDAAKVSGAVDSISQAADGARDIVAGVDATKISGAVDSITKAADGARDVVTAIDPSKINRAVDSVSLAASGASAAIASINTSKINSAVDSITQAADGARDVVAAVDAKKINEAVDNVSKAAAGAQEIVTDVRKVTTRFGARGDDIDQIVTDASQLAARLNASSKKIDGLIDQASALLGGDAADGIGSDIRKTLAEFRSAARTFSTQITGMARGVNRFTGRGLKSTEALINDAQRSINRIDRVIRNIEANPSSLISGSGGSRIRESSGGRVRR